MWKIKARNSILISTVSYSIIHRNRRGKKKPNHKRAEDVSGTTVCGTLIFCKYGSMQRILAPLNLRTVSKAAYRMECKKSFHFQKSNKTFSRFLFSKCGSFNRIKSWINKALYKQKNFWFLFARWKLNTLLDQCGRLVERKKTRLHIPIGFDLHTVKPNGQVNKQATKKTAPSNKQPAKLISGANDIDAASVCKLSDFFRINFLIRLAWYLTEIQQFRKRCLHVDEWLDCPVGNVAMFLSVKKAVDKII